MRLVRRIWRQVAGMGHPLRPLERSLGHVFGEIGYLEHALAHRSWINGNDMPLVESNERLEFLGDAVLDLVVTDHLFRSRPTEDEGKLSKIKSLVVSAKVLAEIARELGVGNHMSLSRSEERGGGRERESILADAFEAVIGAIYLDAGYGPAHDFLHRTVIPSFGRFLSDEDFANYKSALLEYSQGKGWGAPQYEVQKTEGPEHHKRYHVAVRIHGDLWGHGKGHSKKDAEQAAARKALESRGIPVD